MTSKYSCIIVDDEPLAIELLTEQLSHLFKNIHIEASCTNWEATLDVLHTKNIDILFMDISMPGKNGIELLKLLPTIDGEIIFITAHEQYAIDAFKFCTSGYLLKPVSDSDLSHAINRAITRIDNKRVARQNSHLNVNLNDKIGVPNNYGIDYVNINDIIYLESTNKCTKIVTCPKEYVSFSPLSKFQVLIDNHSFFQVHRSFIVNLNSILRYESSGLAIMSNKHAIPVARRIKNDFLELFNKAIYNCQ